MKKTLITTVIAAGLLLNPQAQSQSIDYGMTAMLVESPAGTPLIGGGFQLLGVTPGSGFSPAGASLEDILNAANMLSVSNSTTSILPENPGQFYQDGLLTFWSNGSTLPGGTQLYVLASTSPVFDLNSPWALVTGTDVGWSSPLPTDPFGFSGIELSLTGNSIVAAGFGGPGVGAYWSPAGEGTTIVTDPDGSSLILVPEPSTYALLSLAGIALGGYAMRRRRRS
jgi:hypothetical protein